MDEPTDPGETTTRRGWLSALAQSARRRAQEGAEALGPEGLPGLLAQVDPFGDAAPDAAGTSGARIAAAWRRPARAPDRAVSVDELIAMAHEEGLTGRDEALSELARSSLRMTSVVPRCADAWISTTDAWVDVSGSEVLLAQINLTATAVAGSGLPTGSWLVLFAGTDDEPSGGEGLHAHGVLLEHPAEISSVVEPVALASELVLPRIWHEAVQALDLDDAESAAYGRLRARVQDMQGVERDDDGEPSIAYHRLLGYPDDTTGTMPSECAGPVAEGAGPAEPAESAGGPGSAGPADWRLLAQVSVGEFRRAYVWIRDADLRVGSFAELRAFVR